MKLRPNLVYGAITVATVVAMAGLSTVEPVVAYAIAISGLVSLAALFFVAGRLE